MITGNSPPSPRWQWFVAGTLAAGLAACSGSDNNNPPPADAAVDTPTTDMVTPADGGDVPTPPDSPPVDAQPDAPPADAQPDAPADVPADGSMPSMSTRVIVNCGTACSRPLDAIPNSMGTAVFFTAFTPTGEPAVFRATIPAAGAPPATPTVVAMSNGLEFPVGITLSNDDNTLYVADQSADRGMDPGLGAIFSLPASGGTPAVLNVGTELVQPASITISTDGNDLLIAGQQRNDMGQQRALFRVPRAGGAAMVLTNNLVDPSGVSQGPMGNIIVHDTRRGGARSATAVTVGASSVTDFAGNLVANYPAGLAFATDSRSALFSGADPDVGDGLLTFSGADGRPAAPASLSAGMQTPLGLHRARTMNAWAVADESAGGNGQIFLVTAGP